MNLSITDDLRAELADRIRVTAALKPNARDWDYADPSDDDGRSLLGVLVEDLVRIVRRSRKGSRGSYRKKEGA